eukprot:gnl/Dysnectes_brevis/2586_a3118_902.p1 GENE.gnl/Dysnectes_brevis/2586_a3118_902~~gnl/Dysnectes_brevis/2586_a3118_902.p1  ORF type:complete len:378 (-),score=61.85 gnl/Dysnectes_brevis/2586_a3118_902:39-1172(-)
MPFDNIYGELTSTPFLMIKQANTVASPDPSVQLAYSLRVKGYLYEWNQGNEGNVVLSAGAKDESIRLSSDQMTAFGTWGYRTVRATHGCYSGTWYYEVTVDLPEDPEQRKRFEDAPPAQRPHWRIGFVRQAAEVTGPVGHDRFGYGLRDVDGSVCRSGQRHRPSPDSVYGPGDTVGCLIHMPPGHRDPPPETEMVYRLRYTPNVPPPHCPTVPGSYIRWYVNGKPVAESKNLDFDRYYPAVSSFMCGVSRCNFGPLNVVNEGTPPRKRMLASYLEPPTADSARSVFKYPPAQEWRPFSELYIPRALVEYAEVEEEDRKEKEAARAAEVSMAVIPSGAVSPSGEQGAEANAEPVKDQVMEDAPIEPKEEIPTKDESME